MKLLLPLINYVGLRLNRFQQRQLDKAKIRLIKIKYYPHLEITKYHYLNNKFFLRKNIRQILRPNQAIIVKIESGYEELDQLTTRFCRYTVTSKNKKYSDISVIEMKNQEIKASWIEENLQGLWYIGMFDDIFRFQLETDAMSFKLRWFENDI